MKIKTKYVKGFTLLELLAIIIILAIILVITVPKVSGVVEGSTKKAFKVDTENIIKQIDTARVKNTSLDVTTLSVNSLSDIDVEDTGNFSKIDVSLVDDEPYVVIIGKNKWDGYKACGTSNNIMVVPQSDTKNCVITSTVVYNESKGVNNPQLASGMIPIKWNGTSWIDTTTDDPDWFNYTQTDKKWANARTADGSMWVWIPRYIYRISSGWHTSTTGTIDIKFSMGTDDTRGGTVTLDTGTTASASNNKWTNQPAFTFGTVELAGIWVAKFEATAREGVASTSMWGCSASDDVTTKHIKVIPSAVSWRCINISNMYTVSRNMETDTGYGWDGSGAGIDTHLLKNTEWGALVYLAQSIYGTSAPIWNNPSNTYVTGCAGTSQEPSQQSGCPYSYSTTNGVHSSSTNNVYGIYDLSGSSFEYLAAYVNNGHPYLTANGSALVNADAKYKNVYTVTTDSGTNNYNNAANNKGDALYETSSALGSNTSWYNDLVDMPTGENPFVLRCGMFNEGGALFAFTNNDGSIQAYFGFRPVILVAKGL